MDLEKRMVAHMASGIKEIRLRIKSVESTMQITKAMELVASAKLRRARERLDQARPYFEQVSETMSAIAKANKEHDSIYLKERATDRRCYVVIAGDRGLAGGYNSNLLKHAAALIRKDKDVVVPLGRKSAEYFSKHGYNVIQASSGTVEGMRLSNCFDLSGELLRRFRKNEIDSVHLVYSSFVSMLSQEPSAKRILPLTIPDTGEHKPSNLLAFEPSVGEVFDLITPQFVAGLIYGAVSESFASEQGARRTAMESATDNAEEMISTLGLVYNRARQAAITQEITEIVAGAGS